MAKMLIIGHRGAKGLAAENTKASLQAALDARVDMVEIDVHVSADGMVLLNHDPVIKDADGKTHQIRATEFNDLKAAKPDIITLEEALQFIDNRVGIIIEVKRSQPVESIVACVKPWLAPKHAKSNITLASKDFKLLKRLHTTLPQAPVAIIERWSGVRAGHRAKVLGTKWLIMNQKWLWSGFIKAVTRRGYKLSAYPLNDPKKAARFAKNGLYGAITDFPDRFSGR